MSDRQKILQSGLSHAAQAGLLGSATSVISGAAIRSTPVRFLGLITVGTATSVSMPIVITAAAAGAALGLLAGMLKEIRDQQRIKDEWDRLTR